MVRKWARLHFVRQAGSARTGRYSRTWVRGRTSFSHSQRPLDGFKVHLADIGVLPRFFSVSKGGVEDAALAVNLAPGDREVVVGAVNARVVVVIELGGVQAEE